MADDLESPMVFVPAGEPEPEEWKARHPGWVKFPATMVPRGGTTTAAETAGENQPVFLHDRIVPGQASADWEPHGTTRAKRWAWMISRQSRRTR